MHTLPSKLQALYPFKNASNNYYRLKSGYQLHFVDEGTGHPIVMLHGNPTWSFFYRGIITAFSSTNRCLALDNLGCGLSDKPQACVYNLETHVNNTLEWLAHLDIERFTLIIHDWGGPIGLGVIRYLWSQVDRVVILNTSGLLSQNIPWRIACLRAPHLSNFLLRRLNLFVRAAGYMTTKQALTPEIRTAYAYPYRSYSDRVAIAGFVQDIPLTTRHPTYPYFKELEATTYKLYQKPTLICWGGKDFCFNDTFYKAWQSLLPNGQFEYFPSAGHYVLEDALDPIIKRIQNFITENTPQSVS